MPVRNSRTTDRRASMGSNGSHLQSRGSQRVPSGGRVASSRSGGASAPRGRASRAASPTSRSRQHGNASARPSGVRLGDLDSRTQTRNGNADRFKPQNRKPSAPTNPWIKRIIIIVLIVLALVAAGFFIFRNTLFPVNQVTVKGVSHLTATEVSKSASVPVGSTLLNVDATAIVNSLKQNPWISSARVNRIPPDTLELDITERKISAVITLTSPETQKTENWAISEDGLWLMKIPDKNTPEAGSISPQIYEDADKVLHITDVPYGVAPVVGTKCTDESILNALNIVSQLTTDLANHVAVVSATDSANTLLTLDNGVQIAFGTGEKVRDKERVCLALMEEHPNSIAFINVRVVERPTWRALGS